MKENSLNNDKISIRFNAGVNLAISCQRHYIVLYSFRPKLYDVLGISHILRNIINIVWERDIMSCFTKLSLINDMRKIKERIERWECNK